MKPLKSLKDLKYGKVNRENLSFLMNQDDTLLEIVSKFKDIPYPDTKNTKKEIDKIIAFQKKIMSSPNWDDYYEFCKNCDEDLHDVISDYLNAMDIEVSADVLENFNDEIGMIITSLKKHYNRPRPFQFAYYSEQELNPFETITGNSPSYPSGHACQGWFTCLYFAKKYPNKKDELIRLAKLIENSRIILGVHYLSDNAFGRQIAETIVNIDGFEDII